MWNVVWNYLSISKLQQLHRWSVKMDKWFYPTLDSECYYLSMQGLKLNHVSNALSDRTFSTRFREFLKPRNIELDYVRTWQTPQYEIVIPLNWHSILWLRDFTHPDGITVMYVMMGVMASQITSLTIVYSTVYSGADQRKHQSSASLALCGEFTGEFPTQRASNAENVSLSDVLFP